MTILHIEHTVRDFDAWKATFDSDPADRKGSGVRRYRIVRAADNPNHVMIDLELESSAQAEKMLASLEKIWPPIVGTVIDDPTGRIFEVAEEQDV